ncbi:MAG: amino acid adenylation domain-containing protein [Pseudomonadota bacterium]
MAVTLHRLALDAAMARPQGAAVRCDGEGLSWSELVRRSHGVARVLLDHGLTRGDRVAVLLPKSLDVATAFYGVFAAGGALVPIDPKAPLEPVIRILRATGVQQLITAPAPGRESFVNALAEACPDLKHVFGLESDDHLSPVATPWSAAEALATETPPGVPIGGLDTSYIQHTSGSTGEPKLIRHTHASALAFAEWAADEYALTADDCLSNHSSHHTCFATFDYYAAARAAATTVVLTPAAMLMPASLAALIEDEGSSVWYSVPTALIQLLLRGGLEERDWHRLRWVLFAGETFPEKHLHALMRLLPDTRFSHVYGSTEVNVCTYFHLPGVDEVPSPLPIGRPCSNARALVVDDQGKLVTPGSTGELLIHGATVMSGYWDDPERNRVALAHRPGPGDLSEPWYGTGDRVVELEDGNLAFGGRADLQVKVRGHRVELEEIEHALMTLGPVLEAVTFTVPDGEASVALKAAVVVDPGAGVTRKALLSDLRPHLPSYAMPSELKLMDALPRTPTGKVDRAQLAASFEGLPPGD